MEWGDRAAATIDRSREQIMNGAALRRRVTQGMGIAELKATLAGGLATVFAAGQAIAAVAPASDDEATLWQQDGDGSDDEENDKDNDGHNHHPRGRGGRPAGYRHDRGPNMRDSKDDSSAPSDDSTSTDSDTAPSEGEAPADDGSAPSDGGSAPAEGNTAPTESGAAPVVDDASGGDNIQEGTLAPAASPVPASSAAPIAAAPSDVDFVS